MKLCFPGKFSAVLRRDSLIDRFKNQGRHEARMSQKIGIITHHYTNNFGAFLQLFALYRTLQSLLPGAAVEVIDFRVGKHYFTNRRCLFLRKIRRGHIREDIYRWVKEIQLAFAYRRERSRMRFSRPVTTAEEINALQYDAVVIGSDEVWYYGDSAYSPVKFGHGLCSSRIVSYAPSVGGMEIDGELPEEIPSGLKAFTHLSARDRNAAALAKRHTDKPVQEVLDPTLLYDYEEATLPGGLTPGGYIVCYYEEGWSEELVQALRAYAALRGLSIVGAGCAAHWYDRSLVHVTPFEWVSLFKHAALVITGTFHGTVFGLKFHKKVIACPGKKFPNRQQKILSLLNTLGALGLYFDAQSEHAASDLERMLQTEFDERAVRSALVDKKAQSFDFLTCALS
jgi:hypothetical protein